jgi:biopolymer transport protein ExbD
MNVWKVRHEGSPVTSPDLTFEQVMQGMLDGRFHAEDEVKGPADRDWQKLEDHPAFAEAAADLEVPPEKPYDDETRLDMNALIDVSLVLLIFFILTTTYTNLQKIMEAAEASESKKPSVRRVTQKTVDDTMVHIKVEQTDSKTTMTAGKETLDLTDLTGDDKARIEKAREQLTRILREQRQAGNRVTLLLEYNAKVPHGVIVAIQDCAKGAKMEKVLLLVP